jgi:hypothetical protein
LLADETENLFENSQTAFQHKPNLRSKAIMYIDFGKFNSSHPEFVEKFNIMCGLNNFVISPGSM